MFGVAKFRELGLERSYLRAEDELAVAEHARYRGIDGTAEPAALRGHIDEWNNGRVGSLIHTNSRQWRRSAGNHARRLPL